MAKVVLPVVKVLEAIQHGTVVAVGSLVDGVSDISSLPPMTMTYRSQDDEHKADVELPHGRSLYHVTRENSRPASSKVVLLERSMIAIGYSSKVLRGERMKDLGFKTSCSSSETSYRFEEDGIQFIRHRDQLSAVAAGGPHVWDYSLTFGVLEGHLGPGPMVFVREGWSNRQTE